MAWEKRADACERLVRRRGALPSQSSRNRHERSLAKWIHKQMGYLRRGELSRERLRRLQQIPGMQVRIDMANGVAGDPWYPMADECETFVRERGRLPRRSRPDIQEATLGNWLDNQIKFAKQDATWMYPDRLERLLRIPRVLERIEKGLLRAHNFGRLAEIRAAAGRATAPCGLPVLDHH